MGKSSAFKYKEPDASSGFLLWKITSLWQNKLSSVLDAFELNQTQFAILASLMWFKEHNEETTQAHIAEHTKTDKMTVSKSIRKLENNGLITRVQSGVDARALKIEFTAYGEEITNKSIVAIEKADDDFFSGFTYDELQRYKSLTITIIKNNEPK